MILKNSFIAALTALTLGGAVLATSAPAEAGWGHRHGYGGAVAAGVIGGFAVGAIIASSRPAYAEPVEESSDCYIAKRRFVNAWGDVVIRREQVCE